MEGLKIKSLINWDSNEKNSMKTEYKDFENLANFLIGRMEL